MINKNKLILLTDVIEERERKRAELSYYNEELSRIQGEIGKLELHMHTTNQIIDMITQEMVVDLKPKLIVAQDESPTQVSAYVISAVAESVGYSEE